MAMVKRYKLPVINKYYGYHVTLLITYLKAVKRAESSIQRNKLFFFLGHLRDDRC